MLSPGRIWTAAGVCLGLFVAALAWLSLRAIETDRAEQDARAQAAVEENVRLALWRMDTRLAALVADENMRPTYNYTSVLTIPSRTSGNKNGRVENMFLCSPLLNTKPAEIRTYFQVDAEGEASLPSLPPVQWRETLTPNFYMADNTAPETQRLSELRALLKKRDVAAALTQAFADDPYLRNMPYDGEQQIPQFAVVAPNAKAEPVQVFNGYFANNDLNAADSLNNLALLPETNGNATQLSQNGGNATITNSSPRYINPQNDGFSRGGRGATIEAQRRGSLAAASRPGLRHASRRSTIVTQSKRVSATGGLRRFQFAESQKLRQQRQRCRSRGHQQSLGVELRLDRRRPENRAADRTSQPHDAAVDRARSVAGAPRQRRRQTDHAGVLAGLVGDPQGPAGVGDRSVAERRSGTGFRHAVGRPARVGFVAHPLGPGGVT
ncbi:MAG: hypothetical protein QM811_20280 [Pirellulales bacterium]